MMMMTNRINDTHFFTLCHELCDRVLVIGGNSDANSVPNESFVSIHVLTLSSASAFCDAHVIISSGGISFSLVAVNSRCSFLIKHFGLLLPLVMCVSLHSSQSLDKHSKSGSVVGNSMAERAAFCAFLAVDARFVVFVLVFLIRENIKNRFDICFAIKQTKITTDCIIELCMSTIVLCDLLITNRTLST